MESKAYTKRITQLKARRGELEGELAQARKQLETGHISLIAGKVTAQDLVQAQSLAGTLQSAVEEVDRQIAEVEGERAQAIAEENRQAQRAKLVELANRATVAKQEWDAARLAAHDAILPHLQKGIEARNTLQEVQRAFYAQLAGEWGNLGLYHTSGEKVSEVLQFLDGLGADTTAIRRLYENGLRETAISIPTSTTYAEDSLLWDIQAAETRLGKRGAA